MANPYKNFIALRFVNGAAWSSLAIEWFSRSPFSHVEAILGGITIGSQLRGGVTWRIPLDACYKNVRSYEVWHIPTTPEQVTAFYDFLTKQIGKPYDWRDIVAFALGNRDWHQDDSWICSEVQAAAGEAAHLIKLPEKIPVLRITPRDTYMMFTTLTGATLVESWKR